jgi:predicted transcriptional regulator
VSEASDLETVVDLLDDEYARAILTETCEEPMSVTELGEVCDSSTATIYRRVERLAEADLLVEGTRPRSDGHHDTVYAANLDRVEIRLREGELRFDLERRSADMADQLTRLWGNF